MDGSDEWMAPTTSGQDRKRRAPSPGGLHQSFPAGAGFGVPECPLPRNARGCINMHTVACPAGMRRDDYQLEDFIIHKDLGTGNVSVVYLVEDRATGLLCALKAYRKKRLSALNRRQVCREIAVHAGLQHENVIQLYCAFEDDFCYYLVLEYAARGDLFSELKKRGGQLNEKIVVRFVLKPFLSVLAYLHQRGVVHRDIKPENILYSQSRTLKIADFGLSISPGVERPVTRLGTLDYMAPEVLLCPDKSHPDDNKDLPGVSYAYEVDTWACGVLAYELLVGTPPFARKTREETYVSILTSDARFPSWMSDEAREWIQLALTKDPARRPGILDLLKHPWVALHQRRPTNRSIDEVDATVAVATGGSYLPPSALSPFAPSAPAGELGPAAAAALGSSPHVPHRPVRSIDSRAESEHMADLMAQASQAAGQPVGPAAAPTPWFRFQTGLGAGGSHYGHPGGQPAAHHPGDQHSLFLARGAGGTQAGDPTSCAGPTEDFLVTPNPGVALHVERPVGDGDPYASTRPGVGARDGMAGNSLSLHDRGVERLQDSARRAKKRSATSVASEISSDTPDVFLVACPSVQGRRAWGEARGASGVQSPRSSNHGVHHVAPGTRFSNGLGVTSYHGSETLVGMMAARRQSRAMQGPAGGWAPGNAELGARMIEAEERRCGTGSDAAKWVNTRTGSIAWTEQTSELPRLVGADRDDSASEMPGGPFPGYGAGQSGRPGRMRSFFKRVFGTGTNV